MDNLKPDTWTYGLMFSLAFNGRMKWDIDAWLYKRRELDLVCIR